jgi:hypothetical protein
MKRPTVYSTLLVLLSLSLLLLNPVSAAEDACAVIAKSLDQKKQQLGDYFEALKKLHSERDARLLEVLNFKIGDLSEQIRSLEAEMAGCPGRNTGEGLSAIKSDEDQYATKSCDDLRKMLLQLLRKTASLKRREKSLFSELTTTEKAELQDANRELQIVKSELKKRCSQPTPKPQSQPKSKHPFSQ